MKVEAIALALRPRSMSEASDLGVRLVQANARSVWGCYAPVWAIVAVLALAFGSLAPWAPALIVFWLKPWFDRTLLFVLSRAVFGTPTRLADVWQAQRAVWWQQLVATLTLRRLSPWRAYTQPACQLEGQRGAGWRARRRQLLRDKRGSALAMHSAFAQLESLLVAGAIALMIWFTPESSQRGVLELLTQPGDLRSLLIGGVYAAVVLLVEPFYVGAGFAMYLNRRVELEAWDVEQEFRLGFAG